MPPDTPTLKEIVEGLHQNLLYRTLLERLRQRLETRVKAAICAKDDVDVLRGRAQEMIDLMKDLER
jgi:hypothetical protein